MKKKTTEEFIKEAKLVHNDKYDYSLINYVNNKTKIKIICPIHGLFEQRPNDHLSGKGCKKCGYNNRTNKTTEEFVKAAKSIYNDEYDYSLVEYKNNKTKVKIKHNICLSVFEQRPNDHLSGYRCPICFKTPKKTFEQFIKEAKLVHENKYDYSLVEYKNNKTKIKIICNKCNNIFEQTPYAHIKQNQGCPFCVYYKGEEIIKKYLIENNIKFEQQKKFEDLKDKTFLSYDFYIPSKNLLIEYNGKQHYIEKCFNRTLKDWHIQKHHDWLKRKYAKDNNFNLLIIPYWEFNNIEEQLQDL